MESVRIWERNEMPKQIDLGKGRYALVDNADYELVRQYRWWYSNGYAVTKLNGRTILMHRLLMQPPPNRVVDHLNGKRADNRRKNLRVCTDEENNHNPNNAKKGKGKYPTTASRRKKRQQEEIMRRLRKRDIARRLAILKMVPPVKKRTTFVNKDTNNE